MLAHDEELTAATSVHQTMEIFPGFDTVSVRFVLHDGVWRQVEDPTQCVSDASGCGLVTGCFVPDRNYVLLEPNRDNSSTNLLAHHELFPQHSQY